MFHPPHLIFKIFCFAPLWWTEQLAGVCRPLSHFTIDPSQLINFPFLKRHRSWSLFLFVIQFSAYLVTQNDVLHPLSFSQLISDVVVVRCGYSVYHIAHFCFFFPQQYLNWGKHKEFSMSLQRIAAPVRIITISDVTETIFFLNQRTNFAQQSSGLNFELLVKVAFIRE